MGATAETQTLPDLVSKLKELEEIEKQSGDTEEVLSYEQHREMEIISALIAGRVDEAAELRAAIKLRIDALDEALSKAYQLQERIDLAFEAAIKMSGGNKLDGLAFSARLQFGKASVVIDNESEIPTQHKYVDVNIKRRFPVAEFNKRFWVSVILGRPVTADEFLNMSEVDSKAVNDCMTNGVSKSSLYEALKAGAVPGASLHKSQHLRITPSASEGRTQRAIEKGA